MLFPNHSNCPCHPYRYLIHFRMRVSNRNRHWSPDLGPDHHLHVSTFSFGFNLIGCNSPPAQHKTQLILITSLLQIKILFLFHKGFFAFCFVSFCCFQKKAHKSIAAKILVFHSIFSLNRNSNSTAQQSYRFTVLIHGWVDWCWRYSVRLMNHHFVICQFVIYLLFLSKVVCIYNIPLTQISTASCRSDNV